MNSNHGLKLEAIMNISKNTLIELLNEQELSIPLNELSPEQIAHLYVNSALLVEALGFFKEQLWLQDKRDIENEVKVTFEGFLSKLINEEVEGVLFLKDFLVSSGRDQISALLKKVNIIENTTLDYICSGSSEDLKVFATSALKEMEALYLVEERSKQARDQSLGYEGLRLYRTFDKLDRIFNLDYQLDLDMQVDHNAKERLYQRSGVGVQSGYSTILLALHSIDALPGSTIVDLGSGYGRVGLVCSLMRPDLNFIGYEYVPHRVENSEIACKNLALSDSLSFKVQDLSLATFTIPDASCYYLYDPFSEETYKYVLEQIVEVSRKRKVTIVTKGNARNWLLKISQDHNWPKPAYIDESNLCIFKSS